MAVVIISNSASNVAAVGSVTPNARSTASRIAPIPTARF
jgi:hypothetical protein